MDKPSTPTGDERSVPARLGVGREIRHWRQQRALTLAQVGERSGLNIGYLSQIENGKALPSLEALAQIAAALVMSADVAPVAAATSAAFSALREANVTVLPARANDPPRADPTLPVPMTAIFMAGTPDGCLTVWYRQSTIAYNRTLPRMRLTVK